MNRLILTVISLAICFDGQAQELSRPVGCHVISGNYEIYGQQISGPNLGNTFGPSLILHVFKGFHVHRPGVRSETMKLTVRDPSHLSIVTLDANNTALADDQALGHCDGESFVFSKTTTGGSEGYDGTTTWTVKLAVGPNESLVANVATESKGRDFFVFPHTESLVHSFAFNRRQQ